MKTKPLNKMFLLVDVYEEKLRVLRKVQRAQDKITKLYKEANYILRSQDRYMDYLAKLDAKIGELKKERIT